MNHNVREGRRTSRDLPSDLYGFPSQISGEFMIIFKLSYF